MHVIAVVHMHEPSHFITILTTVLSASPLVCTHRCSSEVYVFKSNPLLLLLFLFTLLFTLPLHSSLYSLLFTLSLPYLHRIPIHQSHQNGVRVSSRSSQS